MEGKGKDWRILSTNIDGIISRKLELLIWIKERKLKVVCITELKSTVKDERN